MANVTLGVGVSANNDDVVCQPTTHGEYIQTQGGTLTIDSDSRWAQNAAVAGSHQCSQQYGGTLLIDGTKTWWLAFDGATGQHGLALTSAQYYDAPAYTDQTTEANNTTANDMTLLPAVPATNDAYYFGHAYKFTRLWLNIGTAGAGTWTITWEFWNGSSWAALTNVRDDTSGFKPATTGWKMVQFSIPTNWATTAVNGVTTYWIRARVSAYTSITTRPLGTQARISTLGMTLTGAGGASGEILGTWDTMGGSPVHGNSTSATGWIKLRSKTGTFVDNEALSINGSAYNGALVNSATGGVRGWIHFVMAEVTALYGYPLGNVTLAGDWFYLDNTTGAAQTIQGPVSDYYPGVWIETAAGSDVYRFWPNAGDGFTSTYLGTDDRCKLVQCTATGLIRIGADSGAVAVGYIPPVGCKVRIPNIILSSANSTDWDVNRNEKTTLSRRGRIGAQNTLNLIIDKVMGTGGWFGDHSVAQNITISNSAFCDYFAVGRVFQNTTVTNVGVGQPNSLAAGMTSYGTIAQFAYLENASVDNVIAAIFTSVGGTAHGIYTNGCINSNFENLTCYSINRLSSSNPYSINIGYCVSCTFSNLNPFGMKIYAQLLTNCILTNIVYCDTLVGSTSSTYSQVIVQMGSMMVNCIIDGISLYQASGGIVTAPYSGVIYGPGALSSCCRFRNVGTPGVPINFGAQPVYISSGTIYLGEDIKEERMYGTNFRSGSYVEAGGILVERGKLEYTNCWADPNSYIPAITTKDALFRGNYGGGSTSATTYISTVISGQRGQHFYDAFHSAIRGKIGIHFAIKTANEPSASSYEIISGTNLFADGANGLQATTNGDQVVWTWPFFILGYTGFTADTPVITGGNVTGGTYGYGNFRIEYCLDKNDGNGFGAWQDMTAANLSAETGISASLGFKPKVRITCISTNAGNYISRFHWWGATDAVSQQVQYPFVESQTITLYGIVVGSLYRIEKASDGTLLAQGTATSTTQVVTFDLETDDIFEETDVVIIVRRGAGAPNYKEFITQGTVSHVSPLPAYISQVADPNNATP